MSIKSFIRPSTLIKLSVALVLPAMVGCADPSAQWAREHTLKDKASAAQHSAVVVKREVAPAVTAPSAKPEPAAAAKTASKARTRKAKAKPQRDADLNAELAVKRLVIAHGVKGREPVKASSAFAPDAKRIYAFVEVSNPERAESAVFVSFAKEGQPEPGQVRLRVGESQRWRTWAYTRLAKKPGRYVAMVHDGQGRLLARAPFEVERTSAADGPKATPDAPATSGAAVQAAMPKSGDAATSAAHDWHARNRSAS